MSVFRQSIMRMSQNEDGPDLVAMLPKVKEMFFNLDPNGKLNHD